MPKHLIVLLAGYILDLCFGDPHFSYHPVCLIGNLIQALEKRVRRWFPDTEKGELIAGAFLAAAVIAVSGGTGAALLMLAYRLHPAAAFILSCVVCYQMLATKSLKDESMKVYRELKAGDLVKARKAVSMIVGRDTDRLTEEGVAKAAVETVAENTSDGVIAPMFYMALFGPVGGLVYKAVNTMDSMIGYKNEKYLYFGRAAARLDDIVNFVPARLAAGLMLVACAFLKLPVKEAYRIFRRDRHTSTSPNSGQTEAVCAGALGVQLLGDAWYFGKLHHKPAMGDAKRQVNYEDIATANRLLYITSYLGAVLFILGYWAVWNLLR